jgi:hypothetical protein
MSKWTDNTDLTKEGLKETSNGSNFISLKNFLYRHGNPVIFTRGHDNLKVYVAEYDEGDNIIVLKGVDNGVYILRDTTVNRWVVMNDKYLVVEFGTSHIPSSAIFTPLAPTTFTDGGSL